MGEGEIKFSDVFGILLFKKHHQNGSKIQSVNPEVKTASGKGLVQCIQCLRKKLRPLHRMTVC